MADDRHFVGGACEGWKPGESCAIKGCDGLIRSVGFCSHHYDMWNRYGHPLAGALFEHKIRVRRTGDKERKAYHAMKTRCYNPRTKAWPGYGGRGIVVCQRWLDGFENFLADMGSAPPGLSLERLEVNGNYEPSNCKWGTPREQSRNTRYTKLNATIVAECKRRHGAGESVVAIAKDVGVSYGAIYACVTGRSWAEIEAAGSG